MKLVNDMIVGIRTIKSYAWEHHYVKKVKDMRRQQLKYVFILNLVMSLGLSIFQNFGFIAVLIIWIPKWY